MTTGGFNFGNPPNANPFSGFNFGSSSSSSVTPNATNNEVVGAPTTSDTSGTIRAGPSFGGLSGTGASRNHDGVLFKSSQTSVPAVRAMSWDPTGAASLSLCPLPGKSKVKSSSTSETSTLDPTSNAPTATAELDVFFSHDALGCPPEETECLIKYLDARDDWLASSKPYDNQMQPLYQYSQIQQQQRAVGLTKLSMDYRAALCECLMQLQSKAQLKSEEKANRETNSAVSQTAEASDREALDEVENGNFELLKVTYAISHLTEIFLLPPVAVSKNDPTRFASRLDGPQGSLTADTIRYLRLHHTQSHALLAMPEVHEMLESDQPEYFKFTSSSLHPKDSSDSNQTPLISGPFEYPYWNLLLHLVRQGELDKAWAVISRHSACRRAEEEALQLQSGGDGEMTPEGEGFATLRAIFLSAPIPGGRGDGYCDDAGLDDFLEEEVLENEEERWYRTAGLSDGNAGEIGEDVGGNENIDEEKDLEDVNTIFMDGVPRNGYLLWEALPRRSARLRSLRYRRDLRRAGLRKDVDDYDTDLDSPSLPESFQPNLALGMFRTWQNVVQRHAFPSGASSFGSGVGAADRGPMASLFRRFPPLQQIVSLLVGSVPGIISKDPGLTWSEDLLMELLYVRPDIMPEDISTRANVAMNGARKRLAVATSEDSSRIEQNRMEDVVLGIMDGNSGRVIESLGGMLGGSSGAALPATVTSLLCNLLVASGAISPIEDQRNSADKSKPTYNIQTELLLLAAESILSSFAVQEQSDVGVRATIRLLLPHAPPKKDISYDSSGDMKDEQETESNLIYEPRFSATIAEVISRHYPANDAAARDILYLCQEVIGLGSTRIADACESLAFCRASYHRSKGNLIDQVQWLLRGMEVQSHSLPEGYRRSVGFASRRHFDALCEQCANALVSSLAENVTFIESESEKINRVVTSVSKVPLQLSAASDVLQTIVQDEVMASVLKGHMEANLLRCAVEIASNLAKGDMIHTAANIVHCLEERCITEGNGGGAVCILANPSMYVTFLHFASSILHEEDLASNGLMKNATSAFSVHGMHVLLCRMTQVLSWECRGYPSSTKSLMKPNHNTVARAEYFQLMRLHLCKGLMRAFALHSHCTSTAQSQDNFVKNEEEMAPVEMEVKGMLELSV